MTVAVALVCRCTPVFGDDLGCTGPNNERNQYRASPQRGTITAQELLIVEASLLQSNSAKRISRATYSRRNGWDGKSHPAQNRDTDIRWCSRRQLAWRRGRYP
jgi:hypothetical protein